MPTYKQGLISNQIIFIVAGGDSLINVYKETVMIYKILYHWKQLL